MAAASVAQQIEDAGMGGCPVASDAVLNGMRFDRPADAGPDADRRELLAAVADARRACEQAQNYFHYVTEPALVDHAVLQLAAAERRYAHLLSEARRAGVRVPWPEWETH